MTFAYAFPALQANTVCTAVLSIAGLPRSLRMQVESAMVDTMASESAVPALEADPCHAQWFTRWSRDRSIEHYYAVTCRQVISGTHEELSALQQRLEEIVASSNTQAWVAVEIMN